MDWRRWLRHTFATEALRTRAFSADTLAAIETAISDSELLHAGEIRFAIERALAPHEVWHGKTPRQRALEVFAALGVWDTDANNGVLIYVLLADHDVEIVADRGFNGRVSEQEWAAVCREMERHFEAEQFRKGAVTGVQRVGKIVAGIFPQLPGKRDADELPNRPAML